MHWEFCVQFFVDQGPVVRAFAFLVGIVCSGLFLRSPNQLGLDPVCFLVLDSAVFRILCLEKVLQFEFILQLIQVARDAIEFGVEVFFLVSLSHPRVVVLDLIPKRHRYILIYKLRFVNKH